MLGMGEATANVVAHAYGPAEDHRGGHGQLGGASWPRSVTPDDGGSHEATNRGRGINIMKVCADDVSVDATEAGTEVRLRFHLEGVR